MRMGTVFRHPIDGRLIARLFGYAACLAYLVIGTSLLLILLIGGFWEGFARSGYTLWFLALCAYVYGTAYLAFRFGRRPDRTSGVLLALLILPVVVQLVLSEARGPDLEAAAGVYASGEDREAVEAATRTLLEAGRRAGRQDHVEALLTHLTRAGEDGQRVRLVCLLGELSYQHEPTLRALRALRQETAASPDRRGLHRAAGYALRGVNPYEPGLDIERAPSPAASLAACRNLAT